MSELFDPQVIPIIGCVVWDENDYDPGMRSLWEKGKKAVLREGLAVPKMYADSKMALCETCKVKVAVGPYQQKAMADLEGAKRVYLIVCLVCATIAAANPESLPVVTSLGNPEDGH